MTAMIALVAVAMFAFSTPVAGSYGVQNSTDMAKFVYTDMTTKEKSISADTMKDHCSDDTKLKRGTALRYTLLAVMVSYKVIQIVLKIHDSKCSYYADCLKKYPRYTYKINIYYSEWISNESLYNRLRSLAISILYGGLLMMCLEGVGFCTYFSCTAVADFCAAFIFNISGYCDYQKLPALYIPAIATCVPVCKIIVYLYPKLFDTDMSNDFDESQLNTRFCGKLIPNRFIYKSVYVFIIAISSIISFVCRFIFVFVFPIPFTNIKFINIICWLQNNPYDWVVALIAPLFVDFVQTHMLLFWFKVTKSNKNTILIAA